MHLLLQPSYTESFNMVTADGVAEGVASVVSTPSIGRRTIGRPMSMTCSISRALAAGCYAIRAPRTMAVQALECYVADGLLAYQQYFAIR